MLKNYQATKKCLILVFNMTLSEARLSMVFTLFFLSFNEFQTITVMEKFLEQLLKKDKGVL